MILLLVTLLLTSITRAKGWKVFQLTRITRQRGNSVSEDCIVAFTTHNTPMSIPKHLFGSKVLHKYDSIIFLLLTRNGLCGMHCGWSVCLSLYRQTTKLRAEWRLFDKYCSPRFQGQPYTGNVLERDGSFHPLFAVIRRQ